MNDIMSEFANNVSNNSFFINIIQNTFACIIFFILAVIVIAYVIMMIKSDIIDASRDKKFSIYMSNHSSGFYLKDINFSKEYLIITEDFFDNVSEHGKIYHKYNLSDDKKNFLIEMSVDYNIIICMKNGYGGMKFAKIIDLCNYDNLPICRIIDYIFPLHNLIMVRKTLKDGSTVYYYQEDK